MTGDSRVLSDAAPTRMALSWRKHGIPAAVSIVVAASSVWLLHRGALPVLPPGDGFRLTPWWLVPAYLLILQGVLFLRAFRWWWLLGPVHPVPLRRIFSVSWTFFGASVILPVRLGELVRPSLLHRKEHVSWWAATGTAGSERILDGLVLSVMLLAGLYFAPPTGAGNSIGELDVSSGLVRQAAYSMLALFLTAFAVAGGFYFRRRTVLWMIDATIGFVSPGLARAITAPIERLADGFAFLTMPRYAVPYVLLTCAYWLLNGFGVWLVIWGVGLGSLTVVQGYAIQGVLALGFLTPNVPGFFGTFQFTVYAGLSMYAPVSDVTGLGAAAVFILYTCQMGSSVLMGLAGLLVEYFTPATPRQG